MAPVGHLGIAVTMLNIGWDTETYLIDPVTGIIPRMVCGSWDCAPAGQAESQWRAVHSTGDSELWSTTLRMFQSAYQQESRIIIHNAQFDVSVALRYCHEVMQGNLPGDRQQASELNLLIWEVLEKSLDNEWDNFHQQGQQEKPILISDTLLREKLYNLSTIGNMEVAPWGPLKYSLADLVMKYFKQNIYDKKVTASRDSQGNIRYYDKDGNDITGSASEGSAWRLRYRELDGIPAKQWPQSAYDYALSDASYARAVWESQEAKRQPRYHRSMNSESLQVYASVALYFTTATGFTVDRKQVSRVQGQIREHLSKIEPILRANGIVRSNGSVNTAVVKERICALWDSLGRPPIMTDGGDEGKNPTIATNKEVQEVLARLDPILDMWAERQQLSKVENAFLPSLQGDRVYTNFDVLKETGRTSSKGSSDKKKQKPIYRAVNSQQMPRKTGIRECFLPTLPGYVFGSIDYGALELCSTAQQTYNLFGYSVHRDKINQGYDLHSYLASSIAAMKNPRLIDEWYSDRDRAYQAFMAHRKARVPDEDKSPQAEEIRSLAKQCKHYRNLAKPVGLGYPGGLSYDTLCVFAKTTYHVEISRQESEEFKQLWLDTYPEMVDYFSWVRQQRDHHNKEKYCYTTPGLERFRAGATYCATANGFAMQSLSADGAKRSVCWLVRAACGGLERDNPYRILDACFHQTFIHDENIIAIPDDDLKTERALAVAKLMIEAMRVHMPDVKISADPCLMRRWTKSADDPEWVDDPAGYERAMSLCERQYGTTIANLVSNEFRAPKGSDKRLVCWDDVHKIKGLEDG